MKLRSLQDRLIVRRIKETQAGAIIVPDQGLTSRGNRAEVIAVGPGKVDKRGVRQPIDVKAGDVVVCAKLQGAEIDWGGEKLTVIAFDDVFGVEES